jgi:hypothetical protein
MNHSQISPCIAIVKDLDNGKIKVHFNSNFISKEDDQKWYEENGMELIDAVPIKGELMAFGIFMLSSNIGNLLEELMINIADIATNAAWKEAERQAKEKYSLQALLNSKRNKGSIAK